MSTTPPKSETLVVAGMHRSGTSMLAAFLQKAGLFVGDELLSANDHNQKGYFENVQFTDLHMKALSLLGQHKDGWTQTSFDRLPESLEADADRIIEQNSTQPLWGWKDPRSCLFLKYWARKLPKANFVFVFRPPWEVADSLYRRGDSVFANCPELAFEIWKKYNQEVVEFVTEHPHRSLLVSVDEVVQHPAGLISEINKRFGLSLSQVEPEFEAALMVKGSRHYQRFVCHHFPNVYGLWLHLETTSTRFGKVDMEQIKRVEEPTAGAQSLDWSTARRLTRETKNLKKANAALEEKLAETQYRLEELEAKMNLIGNSRVWKMRNSCASLLGRPPV